MSYVHEVDASRVRAGNRTVARIIRDNGRFRVTVDHPGDGDGVVCWFDRFPDAEEAALDLAEASSTARAARAEALARFDDAVAAHRNRGDNDDG